ncbi:MAG: hypothetical protein WCQ21_37335 [Verrucomicrobiota bacterium]
MSVSFKGTVKDGFLCFAWGSDLDTHGTMPRARAELGGSSNPCGYKQGASNGAFPIAVAAFQ